MKSNLEIFTTAIITVFAFTVTAKIMRFDFLIFVGAMIALIPLALKLADYVD